jgi:lipid-A-disaccharide synthase
MYTVHPLTYLLGKALVKVKWISMLNIIMQKSVFPELIQHEATAKNLAVHTYAFLTDDACRKSVYGDLDVFFRQVAPFDPHKAATCAIGS